MIITLLPVKVYRIRASPSKPYSSYRYFTGTRKQCAHRMAWWLIWERYDALRPEQIKRRTGLECGCLYPGDEHFDYGHATAEDAFYCDLHARKIGYLARVHTRLTRYILRRWPEPQP